MEYKFAVPRCTNNMTKRVALDALLLWSLLFVSWLVGATALMAQQHGPTLRDVERQLDQHKLQGHPLTQERQAKLEVLVAANTAQLATIRSGGMVIGGLILVLNALTLVGFKATIVRKDNGPT
jgi:hypothetical protein